MASGAPRLRPRKGKRKNGAVPGANANESDKEDVKYDPNLCHKLTQTAGHYYRNYKTPRVSDLQRAEHGVWAVMICEDGHYEQKIDADFENRASPRPYAGPAT